MFSKLFSAIAIALTINDVSAWCVCRDGSAQPTTVEITKTAV